MRDLRLTVTEQRIEKIKKFWLQNPHAVNRQVQDACLCSEQMARKIRKELVEAGILQPSTFLRNQPLLTPDSLPPDKRSKMSLSDIPMPDKPEEFGADDLTKYMKDEFGVEDPNRDLTPEEFKGILSRIARNPKVPFQIVIAAGNAKFKVDQDLASQHDLGPGLPITEEDATVRLTLMNKAVGIKIATAAFERAFIDLKEIPDAANDSPKPPDGTPQTIDPALNEDKKEET